MNQKNDLVSIEIGWSRLIAIINEVSVALVRTSFSSLIRDAHDYACCLFDAKGAMLVNADQGTPGLLYGLSCSIKYFLQYCPPDTIKPGDVLITNDPWFGSGHQSDLFIATPIFYKDNLVGFCAIVVHMLDIGGRSSSRESNEVYEEGLIIPVIKAYKENEENEELFSIIRINVRSPDRVIGDIRAQVTATRLGATRVVELLEELGWESLEDISREIVTRTEAAMQASIKELPEGAYTYELPLEMTSRTGKRLKIKTSVEIKGNEVVVDWEGTSPQVDRPVNVVLNLTKGYTVFTLKTIIAPLIPNNEGCFRPIIVKAPEASILNAKFPISVWWRTDLLYFTVEALYRALSPIVPDKILGGSGSYPLHQLHVSCKRKDATAALFFYLYHGGLSARPNKDGISCLSFPCNVASTSVEVLENDAPIIFEKKELVCDSGGAGKYRGGLGQKIKFGFRRDEKGPDGTIVVNRAGGRFQYPPKGLFGGKDGALGKFAVNDKALGFEERESDLALNDNETVTVITPGGGGYGSPLERDPLLVAKEVRDGFVSVKRAKEDYRVVIDKKTMKLNIEGTKNLRNRLKD